MTKLFGWLSGLDTHMKAIAVLAAIGLVIVCLGTAYHLVDTAFEQAEEKGAIVERSEAQAEIIKNVEKANEAERRYRNDPAVRHAGCLLDATNPEDC